MQIFAWDRFALIWAFSVSPKISAGRRSGHVLSHIRKRFSWWWKCSSKWKKLTLYWPVLKCVGEKLLVKKQVYWRAKAPVSFLTKEKTGKEIEEIYKTGWFFLYRKGIPRILQIFQINVSCVAISFFMPCDYKGKEWEPDVLGSFTQWQFFYTTCSCFNLVFIVLFIK